MKNLEQFGHAERIHITRLECDVLYMEWCMGTDFLFTAEGDVNRPAQILGARSPQCLNIHDSIWNFMHILMVLYLCILLCNIFNFAMY
jgi:hypothetical protein